ncbi:hypothetical protein LT85_0055 [Collimonas arenae]|uniref:Uncharacterized protein n=1 Tax=Collimonas arenae TaxID=279058 RepID=A0A0A1F5Z7_9BURK|nr:hypothetical protein LT85_0055 [Collimonas arenae]
MLSLYCHLIRAGHVSQMAINWHYAMVSWKYWVLPKHHKQYQSKSQ